MAEESEPMFRGDGDRTDRTAAMKAAVAGAKGGASDEDILEEYRPKPAKPRGLAGLRAVLADNPCLSSLLLFIPFGILSQLCGWPRYLVFVFNFWSILPMAWLIGKSTEDLAERTGEALGALLNATFGNIVEMMLCVAGMYHDELEVVQCTLIGSILSNMLLVMGTSFLWGGYNNPPPKQMTYSKVGAGAQSTLMLLAVLGLILPTTYNMLVPNEQAILKISRGSSVLLFLVYVQYLFFQLKTHKDEFETPDEKENDDDDEDEEEEPDLDVPTSLLVLATCTILTAACSEFLICSIKATIDQFNISKQFIGIVVLPIIGNAAEHYTAIIVAGQNKMDLSLGVAVGSSCQMALMVTPFTVICGWVMNKPMTLDFHPFQVTVLMFSVLLVANVLKDGESNWLEGSMLVTAYCAIALIYFFEEDIPEALPTSHY